MKMTQPQTPIAERNLGIFQKGYNVSTIYIGNMSYSKREKDIKKMFSKYGVVNFVKLVLDPKTRLSKGIAFVQMPNKKEAQYAIEKLNEQQLDGRTLKVSIAKENGENKDSYEFSNDDKSKKNLSHLKNTETKFEKILKKKKRPKGLKVLFNHLNSR
jgi:RNA recognition motif-containing protein